MRADESNGYVGKSYEVTEIRVLQLFFPITYTCPIGKDKIAKILYVGVKST